jgi:hypothetical protein
MQHRFSGQTWLRSAFSKNRALDRKHFTKAEAEAKVGKNVLAWVAWFNIPQGTAGRVIGVAPVSQVKSIRGQPVEMVDLYDIAIQWKLPTPAPWVRRLGNPTSASTSTPTIRSWTVPPRTNT